MKLYEILYNNAEGFRLSNVYFSEIFHGERSYFGKGDIGKLVCKYGIY